MKQAYVTVGITSSGKSKLAEKMCDENPNMIHINRDKIRFTAFSDGQGTNNFEKYVMSKDKEREVTHIFDSMLDEATKNNNDIVISDTNLNPFFLKQLLYKLTDRYYDITILELDITLADAVKFDYHRERSVGYDLITIQHKRFQEYKDIHKEDIQYIFKPNFITYNEIVK